MLDPEQQADFEEWRGRKILGQVDISPAAYNSEMEGLAVAWEEGVKRLADYGTVERDWPLASIDLNEVIATNPYRRPGMRGERPSTDAPVPVSGNQSEAQLPAGAGPGETNPVEEAQRAFGIKS